MSFPVRVTVALALVAGLLLPTQADAAQTLAQVQAKVRQLEEEATTAAEGAQDQPQRPHDGGRCRRCGRALDDGHIEPARVQRPDDDRHPH